MTRLLIFFYYFFFRLLTSYWLIKRSADRDGRLHLVDMHLGGQTLSGLSINDSAATTETHSGENLVTEVTIYKKTQDKQDTKHMDNI